MTSTDNCITVEIFNARMDRLEAINEKNLALIQKENAEFREQIKEENRLRKICVMASIKSTLKSLFYKEIQRGLNMI